MEVSGTTLRNREIQMVSILLETVNWRTNQITNYICNCYNVKPTVCMKAQRDDLDHVVVYHPTPIYKATNCLVRQIKQHKPVNVSQLLFSREQLENTGKSTDDLKLPI